MSLSRGTRLGPYEILSPLGAGGMGEVYKARDTRLDRSVAIKVSAEQFSERFEQEARAISSLNHPHICTLHDVGPNYLVMELVEGETLAERIAAGPVPLSEALPIARQIAEAVEAAHEKGVIHRDLKPANVKITPDGAVKVLDFGLAKITEAVRISSDPSISPTMAMGATRAGMILGTAAYMAPEQARGVVVDKRADIWAFGCVLYEMLTAQRAFSGESITDVLAAVVRAEPDWNALPAHTPAPVRKLLKRCLEKDRKRRLPDIGVARLEIDDAILAPEEIRVADPVPKRRSKILWLAAAVAVLVAAGAGAIWQSRRVPAAELWSGMRLGGPSRAYAPRLSPDGQLLAFLAFVDELPQLGVMKPGGGSWTMLTNDRTSGYIATAAWARDGSKIYFDRYWGHPHGVYTIPPLGGEPRLLLEDAYGPEPLADGTVIVAKLTDQNDHQLFRWWPDSGRLDPLPAFIAARDTAPLLRAFPDGKEIVYYGAYGANGRSASKRMYVMDLASQRARELAPGVDLDPGGSWSPLAITPDGTSALVLSSEQDTRILLTTPRGGGTRPRVLLSFSTSAAPGNFDVARDGSIYADEKPTLPCILWFSAAGGAPEESFVAQAKGGNNPMAFLPNGAVLSVLSGGGKNHLVAFQQKTDPRILIETSEETSSPAIALAGDSVAFIIGSGDESRLAIASLRDGRVLRRFPARVVDVASLAASVDGKTLYYSSAGWIWAQPVAGGEPRHVSAGTDVALDRTGLYLFVKRNRKGIVELFRVPLGGGDEEKLFVPDEYHLAQQPLSPVAADPQGRILVTVLSAHSFYYRPAILDPVRKSLAVVPVAFDGDVYGPGWSPDGRIAAFGQRYLTSLWRYRPSRFSAKK